jgi:hypothetical protein
VTLWPLPSVAGQVARFKLMVAALFVNSFVNSTAL